MISVCTFHSLIARRWRDRRIFIAGDAAHQTPPFLGQGMCAGIRDAANLAWKFKFPQWLDSYQSERGPHVRVYIEEALRLGAVIQTTDPKVAAERDRRTFRRPRLSAAGARRRPAARRGDRRLPMGRAFSVRGEHRSDGS